MNSLSIVKIYFNFIPLFVNDQISVMMLYIEYIEASGMIFAVFDASWCRARSTKLLKWQLMLEASGETKVTVTSPLTPQLTEKKENINIVV